MEDNTNQINRRNVLRSATALSSVSVIGKAAAESTGRVHFAEVGIEHQFNDLPDTAEIAHRDVPISHQIAEDDQTVILNTKLCAEKERGVLSSSEPFVWFEGYSQLPFHNRDRDVKSTITTRLNDNYQPVEMLLLENRYKIPPVRIKTSGESLIVRSQGRDLTVEPREHRQWELRPKWVVAKTNGESRPRPVRSTPVLSVENYGMVDRTVV